MKLCMGCMETINDSEFMCPYCGYDERRDTQEAYYLTPGTVIAGKYIAGKVLQYNGYVISYIGWDAEHEYKVQIQEYMASDYATRVKGEQDLTIYSGEAAREYENGLSLFMNEGSSMQRLSVLPGIAVVYDCCVENATGYLVTEYLSGKTLKEILDSGKRYTFEEACQFLQPVLASLCSLHEAGIMHYDIAPENIVMTVDGKVKLVNFGAARYMTTSKSKSLAVVLKQGYAPEEQYRSQGKKGSWSDVYAIAAVLYHMITGIVPEESVERSVDDRLKDPSKCGASISKSQENALMNALNIYASDRTKTMRQFCEELNSGNVKRIRVKQNNSEKSWAIKKLGIAALAAVVIAFGGIMVYKSQVEQVAVESDQNALVMGELEKAFYEKGEDGVIEIFKKKGFQEKKISFRYVYTESGKTEVNSTEPVLDQLNKMNSKDKKGKKEKQKIEVEVTSPDFVTITQEDLDAFKTKEIESAIEILKNRYGFIDIQSEESEDYDNGTKGTVLEVKIANYKDSKGKKIGCDEKVTVRKAFGSKDQYEGPLDNLIGVSYSDISERKKNRLPVTKIDAFGTGWGSYKDGDIVATDPKAGATIVKAGRDQDQVKCYVYNTKLDFEDLTESNIKERLKGYNLKTKYMGEKDSSTLPEGSIIYKDTSVKVKEGDTVEYWVSKKTDPEPSATKPSTPNTDKKPSTTKPSTSDTDQKSGTMKPSTSDTDQKSGTTKPSTSDTDQKSGTTKPSKPDTDKSNTDEEIRDLDGIRDL